MDWRGAALCPRRPAQARATGVAMVFQHFSLFDALDVAENVALGMDNPPPLRDLAPRIRRSATAYGLPLDPVRLWATCRPANASGSRSSAACCRIRNC
jgi:general nucleoside transport system ATP-binding protein